MINTGTYASKSSCVRVPDSKAVSFKNKYTKVDAVLTYGDSHNPKRPPVRSTMINHPKN